MEIGSSSGLVNSLICNAGINGPSLANMPANPSLAQFREYAWGWDADHFNETFAVNTTAVFNTAIAFLELLDAGNQRSGLAQKSQIIATSSIGAFNRSALAGYAYSGAKAAVVHIMKQLATSLVPYNIRANIIAPGCEYKLIRPQSALGTISEESRLIIAYSLPKRTYAAHDHCAQGVWLAQEYHTRRTPRGYPGHSRGCAFLNEQSRCLH